ncbi:MAG: DNA-binding protein [Lactobacillus sp.]|nr:MAG: DNA-binding protein [Lactobacillus sp.]
MNIIPATKLDSSQALRMIYGAPGTGKTTAVTFLEGKTLLIDLDGSSKVLKGQPNIDVIPVESTDVYHELGKMLGEIHDTLLDKYDHIVLDNLSELQRLTLSQMGESGNNDGVPAQGDYQRMQFYIPRMLNYLRSWNKDVLVTAWEMTDQWTTMSGQVFDRAYPDINKKILQRTMGLCNVVGRLVISQKTGERVVALSPSDELAAKNQLDKRKYCRVEDLFNGKEYKKQAIKGDK